MDKANAIKIAKKYKDLLAAHVNFSDLYLYGSYAKGNFTDDSDIDIAIIMKNSDYKFLDISPILWKLRREIDLKIEPIIVDKENDKSQFYEQVVEHGIMIY